VEENKVERKSKSFLIVNSSFYPSTGGVETTLRGMAEGLVNDGHQVTVVSGDRTNINSNRQKIKDRLFGAKVYRYKTLPFFLYYITCTVLLRRLKNRNSFDLIISRSYTTTLCLLMAGYKNIKYIAPAVYSQQNKPVFVRGSKYKKYISYHINSMLESVCIRFLPEIYVFSSEMEKQIKDISPNKKVFKVFPGVDKNRFFPVDTVVQKQLREKHGIPKGKKVLLFIGRVEPVKNPIDTIEVLKYLPENYVTTIVGEGSIKKELIEFARDEELSHRVYFRGFTSEPEEFFQLSDAFLMTSIYEPFGQVILEALACGTHVYGYESSKEIRTATSEIFKKLNIEKTKKLVVKSNDCKAFANIILDDLNSAVESSSATLSWSEFAYRLSEIND